MTPPDPAQVPASPLCRVGHVIWMRHELDRAGVCVRCGWALPGPKDGAAFSQQQTTNQNQTMSIRAKVKCTKVNADNSYGEDVQFHAVYSEDKTSENYSFSQATPNLTLTMTISNPTARGVFKDGAEYYLDIKPVA